MSIHTVAGADDEVGRVLSALKSLHIRVGFDLAETRRWIARMRCAGVGHKTASKC